MTTALTSGGREGQVEKGDGVQAAVRGFPEVQWLKTP